MSQIDECQQQKHTQHIPSLKMECNKLYSWILKKIGHIHKNLKNKQTKKIIMNPRYLAGSKGEAEMEISKT